MRIEIIGGGAIGMLIAARLARSGEETAVWTRSSEQSEELRRTGIRLQDLETDSNLANIVQIESRAFEQDGGCWLPEAMPDFCWLIVAVKQSHLDASFMKKLRERAVLFKDRAAIVAIQNGVGHLEKLADALEGVPVFAAVTTEGAKRLGVCSVQHTGRGRIWISKDAVKGKVPAELLDFAQKKFIEIIQKAGFDALLSNDINDRILHKLLINAVINPLTAIFHVLNGELPRQPERLLLMKSLYAESEAILRSAGMLQAHDSWEQILQVCRQTSDNESSMLSDIRAGRLTEIDSINGAIADMAYSFGMDARMNQAIVTIVHAMERK
ncbi:2-dehydropantoate 2-reductase [Paenibacillus sp. HB172176]|uniref:ketopantoate reductase family protein n=1 Tax=Paenibacillus sp. HB172176 TaxID=2493690 RepID=UPI001438EFDD|nr:2-dehydropantoate 2-reductase [Paenibacillus sp. HB172176]